MNLTSPHCPGTGTALIGEESREARIIWWRPWHDDVWLRNPFSGEPFLVSKRTLPAYWQAKLSATTPTTTHNDV